MVRVFASRPGRQSCEGAQLSQIESYLLLTTNPHANSNLLRGTEVQSGIESASLVMYPRRAWLGRSVAPDSRDTVDIDTVLYRWTKFLS